MGRFFISIIRMSMLLAAASLAWSCATPPVKPPEKKPVKAEIKKVEKKQPKKAKKKRKPKKRKAKKTVQVKPAEPAEAAADQSGEPVPGELTPGEAARVVGRMMFHYEYYPAVEVYFDTIRNLYFYRDKGTWTMSVALPTTFQENLGRSVRLKMADDRPYVHHRQHREEYPGWQAE